MLISEAIKEAGCEGKVKIAMDCAASEFYSECSATPYKHVLYTQCTHTQPCSALPSAICLCHPPFLSRHTHHPFWGARCAGPCPAPARVHSSGCRTALLCRV